MTSPESPGRPWRLLALADVVPEVLAGLTNGLPYDLVVPPKDREPGVDGLSDDLLADAEIVLGDWRTAHGGFSAAAVKRAPRLAFVQQPSVGVQSHDAEALAAAGVPLSNVAGFNAIGVAEWALAAALSAARLSSWAEARMRAGGWPQTEVIERGSRELGGRTVGILGFGAIGSRCAPRFAALGCPVSYWSRRRRPAAEEFGATYRELDDLLATSEIVIVTLPLTPDTRGLLNAARIATLPAGGMIVVASRGEIVDEAALAAAVAGRRLQSAAFDVYATEPLPADSPLRDQERILLTPHVAGSSAESSLRLMKGIRANLTRAAGGEPVHDVVNGVDPVIRRRA